MTTVIGILAFCMAVFFLWASLQRPFPEWCRNWVHKKLGLPAVVDRVGVAVGALIGFIIAAIALSDLWLRR